MSLESSIRKHNTLFRLSTITVKCGHWIAPKFMIRVTYRLKIGRWPNLDSPQTFTEKIQWIRLHDRDPLKTKLADKYLVREWVAEKIGNEYLIPLLGAWDSVDEIDFEKLPNQFVLKANHGSNMNIIVRNKDEINLNEIKKKCRKWLKTNYGKAHYEMQYSNIPRKIVAEKYMETESGDLPDYKVLCFDGKAKYIWVDNDRYISHRRTIYDIDWNLQPFSIAYPVSGKVIKKPNIINKMISLAEVLSSEFNHVRVDFYIVGDDIYFGEMTFTSDGGFGKFDPDEYDYKLGELVHFPK